MVALPHWRLSAACAFQLLLGFNTIFDYNFLNPHEPHVKNLANESLRLHYGIESSENVLEWIWSTTTTVVMLGAILGTFSLKFAMEKFGRRNTAMVITNLFAIPGFVAQLLAQPLTSIELLIVGRFLVGMAITFKNVVPVYMAECSPVQFRSLASSAPATLGPRIWLLVAAVGGIVSREAHNWFYFYLVPISASVLHLLATPLLPKSVKHLLISKEQIDLGRKASAFYHGPNVDMAKLQEEMTREADISPTVKVADLKLTLMAPQFRWPFLLCLLSGAMAALSGSNIAMSYSRAILSDLGVSDDQSALYNMLILIAPLFFVSASAILLIGKLGCRKLLLLSIALGAVGSACLGVSDGVKELNEALASVVTIVSLALMNVGYALGSGWLYGVLPTEIAPQASRSLTCGATVFCTYTMVLIALFVFPPINRAIGTYCMLPFTALSVGAFACFYIFLPETKERPIYSIVSRWMPSRKVGCAPESQMTSEM